MSLHTKVVFPSPPPTTNALTPEQRIQLVRKTRKIEQIFGTTPYLLDSPIETLSAFHVHFPNQSRHSKSGPTKKRTFSVDAVSSDSFSTSPISIARKLSLSNAPRSASPRNHERNSRPSTPSSIEVQESWPVSQGKSPVLRLAVQSPLDTIPGTPDPKSTTSTFSLEPISQALDLDQAPQSSTSSCSSSPRPLSFFDGVTEDTISPQSTSFIIPSRNSIRKQKLDRLRKKLGCEVPTKLILSQVSDLDDSDVSPSPPSSPIDSRHQLGANIIYSTADVSPGEYDQRQKPIPRTKRASIGKIAGARDSITDLTISGKIHRAKRRISIGSSQSTTSSSSSESPNEKKLKAGSNKSAKKGEPTPSSLSRPVISSPTNFRHIKDSKLSLIIESPEEFGLNRIQSTRCSSPSSSEASSTTSFFEAVDTEMKLWNTRKEHDSWRPSTPGSEASSTPPTTPSSPVSTQSLMRRSSSYRKPPPPIPAECL